MSDEIDYCPHTDYPIQVTLTLLDGDVDVTHTDCGRIVQTGWPYLRADHVPLELVYATDGDEDWLELRATSTKQSQNAPSADNAMGDDDRAQLARIPLPDRIDLIAQHLTPATEELRGLIGASHPRLLIAAAVASLRWVVDDLRSGKERAEQPQDERDASLPGLLCRATAMHEEGVRHYCTLNTAAHAVHQCGDCGHVWTDSGEEFETVLAERNQLRLQAAAQDERDGDVRAVAAWLAADSEDMSPDYWMATRAAVRARFADRIAELDARDAEAGGSDG